MSNDSSSSNVGSKRAGVVPWNPWLGVTGTILLFLTAQVAAAFLICMVPIFSGWSDARTNDWLKNSFIAQVAIFPLSAAFMLLPLYYFLKRFKDGFRSIGLRRPTSSDFLWSLGFLPVYIFAFAIILAIVKALVPSLDVNQAQDLGLNGSYNSIQLIVVGVSLVILAPITEEIIFRGMIYSSFKKALPVIIAAILTSILFASGHLLESGDSSLLYIAGIDTFVLSLILVYLREKTGGLWASIGLHALKNGIAFVSVFVLHLS